MKRDWRLPIFVTGFTLAAMPAHLALGARPMERMRQDGGGAASAPAATAAAAGTAQAAQQNRAVVVSVVGSVQLRPTENDPWTPATIGATVPQGGQFRTGVRSQVVVRIGEAQLLTIDRLGVATIDLAVKDQANVDRTQVDLPYGRVSFNVTSTAVANDFQVKAPGTTLAVRGTEGTIEVTGGQPVQAYGSDTNTGTIVVEYEGGDTGTITENAQTTSETPNPVQFEVENLSLDTGNTNAREGDETQVVDRSTGGGDNIQQNTNSEQATGGPGSQPPPPPSGGGGSGGPPPPPGGGGGGPPPPPDGGGGGPPPPPDGGGGGPPPPPDGGGGGPPPPPDGGGGSPPSPPGGGPPPPTGTNFTASFLLSDRAASNLRLRTLSNTPVADVTYATGFPAGFSGGGALATHRNPDGSLTVYQLMSGTPSGGGAPNGIAFNTVYTLNFPAGGFFPSAPASGVNFNFFGRFADGSSGPVVGKDPFTGIAYFDGKLYLSGSDEALTSGIGPYLESGGTAIFEASTAQGVQVKPVMTFGPYDVRAIAKAQGRGALFASVDAGPSINFLSRSAILEVDPRINHLVEAYNSAAFVANAGTNLGSGALGSFLAEDGVVIDMTHDGTNIIVALRTAGPNTNLGDSDDRRIIVTVNPNASDTVADPRIRRIDLIAPTVDFRGLAAIDSGATAPGPVAISAVDDGQFDGFGFDPLFNRMSYSVQAAASTPLVNAVRDMVVFNASAFTGCVGSGILTTGNIQAALSHHVNVQGGVGRALYELTAGLSPSHPCFPESTFDNYDYTALFKNTITAGDLSARTYPFGTDTLLNNGIADLELEAGLATQFNPNGNGVYWYMAGGELDANNLPVNARNELFSATWDNATGQISPFSTVGLVQTPSLGGVPAVLTGLAVLDGVLYANQSKTTFSSNTKFPKIVSIDPNARIPASTEVMDIRMHTKGLAASDRRGSLFAVGLYDGGSLRPGAPAGDRGNTYQNLALWEIDPRNKYVKNTWWGDAGDFNASSGTVNGVGFSLTTFPTVGHIGDAATAGRYVVIAADVGFSAPGGAFNSFYITVNPDASGANSPFVVRRDTANGEDVRALAGEIETGFFPAPTVTLANPGGGVDNTTINPLFAQTSYSSRSLRSGLLQAVYSAHFLATSNNSAMCAGDAVFAQIPTALSNNAGKTNGIGRATFDLRNSLPVNHVCQGSGSNPN